MRVTLSDLTELQFLNGLFTLIFMIINIYIGVYIASRYRKYKVSALILVGLTWIFLTSAWWGTSLSFILIVLIGYAFDPPLYIYIGSTFVPVAIVCWAYAVCSMTYKKYKKIILLIYLAITISYEIFLALAIFAFSNPDLIAIYQGLFYLKPSGIGLLYIVFAILTFIIIGIIFVIQSLKSDNVEVKLKGKYLLFLFF